MELLFLVLFSLHILKTEAIVGVDALEQTDVLLRWCIQGHHSSKFKSHWSPDCSLFLVTCNDWAVFSIHRGPSHIINAQFKDHLEQVGHHWCYLSQKNEQPSCEGPRQWHTVDAKCKGSKQSPINIITKNVIYDKSLTPLYFEDYDVKASSKWKIENNGHTVKVTLSTNPKISGGGLKRKYKAVEFHLHWGVQEEQLYFPGSEHSIDGEKQAMELHIVHIREDALDLTDAKNFADGIAVLAFFVKIDEENKNYATLISELDNILQKDTSSQMEALPLSSLLPPVYELVKYYRYEGSLTTPDCHETVIWTVFEKPIQLSLLQVSQFSTVHFGGKNSTVMSENFRPAQLLNGRNVYWSSASSLLPPAKVLMLALILPYLLNSLFQ